MFNEIDLKQSNKTCGMNDKELFITIHLGILSFFKKLPCNDLRYISF